MQSGGGGLSSTITDYAIFMQMMLNGGEYNGVRILSRNTVRMMTQNQIGELNNGVNKVGLGFGVVTEKGSSILPLNVGSFQWGGMFSTTYWADPKEKIVGLFSQMCIQPTAAISTTASKYSCIKPSMIDYAYTIFSDIIIICSCTDRYWSIV